MKPTKDVHVLAAFVHGALAALHTLGVVYNARRRNWWDVAAHSLGVAYDVKSARHHYLEATNGNQIHAQRQGQPAWQAGRRRTALQ